MIAINKTRGCLNFQLRRTSRLLARYYDDALRPFGLRQYRKDIELRNAQTEGPECIIVISGEQPRRSPQLEIKAAPRLVDCYHQIPSP